MDWSDGEARGRGRCQRAAGRIRMHRALAPAPRGGEQEQPTGSWPWPCAGRRSDRADRADRPPTRRVMPGAPAGRPAGPTALAPLPAQRGPSAAMLQLQVAQDLLRPECIRQMSDRCLAQPPPSKKPSPMKRDSKVAAVAIAADMDRGGVPAPVSTARWYGPATTKQRQGLPTPDQAAGPAPPSAPPLLELPRTSASKPSAEPSLTRVTRRCSGSALRQHPDVADVPRPCRRRKSAVAAGHGMAGRLRAPRTQRCTGEEPCSSLRRPPPRSPRSTGRTVTAPPPRAVAPGRAEGAAAKDLGRPARNGKPEYAPNRKTPSTNNARVQAPARAKPCPVSPPTPVPKRQARKRRDQKEQREVRREQDAATRRSKENLRISQMNKRCR
ncbi:uncharacterized protein C11orf24-like [Frankliniella occidentalis]|uniref:Uncharacterized protein C11orf24-like n=1 Tax=Frankliniella occidentalis TaxID=133901 RepID=A0A9C6U3X6_FRAOC|nr:uncharacterized protein C11orf24-like [Frankliniella occidentalis]XP_052120644.1 uncharacterized protein C11orf24-like [Frankliniella occidentalis]